MSQKIYTDLVVKGGITLGATNAGTDTDKFLVQDTNGTIRYRTGAEVLEDIGAGTGGASDVTYSEIPSGLINGINFQYTLVNTPTNTASVLVVLDGVIQYNSIDFIVLGNVISFDQPPAIGSSIFAYYNLISGGGAASPTNLSYIASPTDGVVGSDTGTSATLTLANGTNAGLLKPSDFTQLSNLTSNLSGKQASLSGTGFVKSTAGVISYDTNAYYLNSNPSGYTTNTGTVTSVGITVPTGLTITSGSPITGSGTIAIALASGYSIPTTTIQATWSGKQNALSGTGFIKISGTTISYDNSSYALDSNVVHRTTNELVSGVKSFTGPGITTHTPFSNTLANFVANDNSYQIVYAQNLNNGSDASADFVAYNDASDVNSYFIDMGINSSNFSSTSYPIFPVNSGYLFTGGGTGIIHSPLYIGTSTILSDIVFFTGGVELSNVAGYIKAGTKHFLFGQDTDDETNTLQVTGGIKSTGDVTIIGAAYADGDIGSNPHQLVTKEYVDNAASAGLHVHTPVRVERHANITSTYTNGGTTPVITAIASNSILTSAGHSLLENDVIVFTASSNGIIAGDSYFVFQVLSSSTFTISLTLNGPAISTLTNGTGLSITSRANSGVGATLTNSGTQAVLVISTITMVVGDRVLIQNQTNGYENGVYTVTNIGSPSTNWVLTRATDANKYGYQDPAYLGGGDYFYINEGTPGAGESYVLTTSGEIIFGTTSLTFTKFSSAPTYTGTSPINVTGQIISLTGVVGPTKGGTGTGTIITGDLLYGSATDTWSKLALGAAYKSLVVNASGTQLEWNAVALNQTTAVSGQLGIANGGTGTTTAALALAALGGQPLLSGTGFVKSTIGIISYDTNSYYLASNPSGYTTNTGTVTGTSTIGYVPFWTSTAAIGGSSSFFWDNTNKYLGIGTNVPSVPLHVRSTTTAGIARIQGLGDVDNYSVLELWDDTGTSKWQFAHKVSTTSRPNGFTFAHWNGASWIQPVSILESGRMLVGEGTVDDNIATNLLQVGGHVRATGYKVPSGVGTQFLKADGTTDSSTYLTSVGIANLTATGTPSATTYLRGDNTWATVSGGAGGSPGGTVNEIQYNDGAGGFAGAANVEVDTGNLKLVPTTDPSPPIGGLVHYAKVVGGRTLPKIIGPSGIDTILQVGLHGNSIFMVSPANATTAPNVIGGVITTATTISHQQTIASANPWQATRRTRFQTSTTAGNASGARTAYTQWFRGNATGFGGFWFRCQLGMNINLQGGQKFVGLCNSTGALAGDPSALLNMCGMGYDAADLNTGSWSFMYNDGTGTATKVNLGANAVRNTTHGYDLIMYMTPGGSELFVRIVNIHTNVVVLETSYTTLLPVANTGMAFKAEVRNGAVAAADNIEIAKVYIETDY